MSRDQVMSQLEVLSGWEFCSDPERICKSWVVRDFAEAITFFRRIAEVAEAEAHHPDLHVVRFRHVSVEIWTHAIQGLSLNDFILAARIDVIPVQLRA